MAEIEITLPTVQYGNVKLRATPEELGLDSAADAAGLGVAAAVYLNAFQQGFKRGAAIDVDIDSGPKPPPPASIERVELDPAELIKTQLGGTVVEEFTYDPDSEGDEPEENDNVPWNRQVAAKPKPWETGSAAPVAVAEIDW